MSFLDRVKEKAEELQKKAKPMAEAALEKAKPMAEKAKEQAGKVGEQVKKSADGFTDGLRGKDEDAPGPVGTATPDPTLAAEPAPLKQETAPLRQAPGEKPAEA